MAEPDEFHRYAAWEVRRGLERLGYDLGPPSPAESVPAGAHLRAVHLHEVGTPEAGAHRSPRVRGWLARVVQRAGRASS